MTRAKVKAKPAPKAEPKTNAAHRAKLFAEAFLANGGNKRAAAVAAGYKEGAAADKAGTRLSKNVQVLAMIAAGQKRAEEKAELTTDRTLKEIARVAFFDIRRLYDKETGAPLPLHKLDADTAGALSHEGRNGPVPFDKNAAIEKAMKHLGLYKEDNKQQGESAAAAILAHVHGTDQPFAVKP